MFARTLTALALMLGSVNTALAQPAQPAATKPEDMARFAPLPDLISAPADPDAIPLYGSSTPGSAKSENWSKQGDNVIVRNVTRPTLTPVLPAPGKATGAAVIVAPGGGFTALSTDTEGFQVARVLAAHGIAAFVLKYRLIATPADETAARVFSIKRIVAAIADPATAFSLQNAESTEDGLAAVALVRSNAAKWSIDPKRVGIMGFSAGAMTALSTSLAAQAGNRPAFIGYVYGPQIAPAVPADAPPLFNAIALDDQIFHSDGFPIVAAWLKAKRPVEVHGYGRGGHGFGGLGMKDTTTTLLMDEFMTWLSMQGFLRK